MKIPAWTAMAFFAVPLPLAAQDGGAGLVSVDIGLALSTIVVFALVLWVLGKFAWGHILGALDAREEGIRSSIDEAATMRAEAEELLEKHRRQLADARREAQQIVSEGRSAAERVRQDLEAKARAESERMIERARLEIERERDRALEQVREEAVDLALAAAGRLLDEKLGEARDRELVAGYLEDLETKSAEA